MEAKVARMISDLANKINPILQKIEEAAKKGYNQITIHDMSNDLVLMRELKKLGYELPIYSSRDVYGDVSERYCTVKW